MAIGWGGVLRTVTVRIIGQDLMAPALRSSEDAIRRLGASLITVGRDLTLGLTLPIVGMGYAASKAFTKFDEQLRNVQAIGRLTDEEIGALADSFVSMSTDLTKTTESASDLAKGFYFIQSAGKYGKEAMTLLELSTKGATAGMSTTELVAKTLISTLNAYGASTSEAAHYSDVLFRAVDVGVFTFTDLASQIGDVAPMAALTGVNIEELAAAFVTMSRVGINTAEASTAINRFLMSYVKQTDKAKAAAAALGIDLSVQHLKSVGLAGALKELIDKTGLYEIMETGADKAITVRTKGIDAQVIALENQKQAYDRSMDALGPLTKGNKDAIDVYKFQIKEINNQQQALRLQKRELVVSKDANLDYVKVMATMSEKSGLTTEQLAQMFPNIRALRGAIVLAADDAKGFNVALDQMKGASEGAGATQTVFEVQTKSAAAQMKNARNTLSALGIEFGEILVPALVKVLQALLPFIRSLTTMPTAMKKTIITILGVAAAIGPLLLFLGKLFQGFAALITVSKSLTYLSDIGRMFGHIGPKIGIIIKLLPSLLGPLALVVGALALLAVAYKTNFMGFKVWADKAFADVSKAVSGFVKDALPKIIAFAQAVGVWLVGAWQKIQVVAIPIINQIVAAVSAFIKDALPKIIAFAQATGIWLVGAWQKVSAVAGPIIAQIGQAIRTFIDVALPKIIAFGQVAREWIIVTWQKIWTTLKPLLAQVGVAFQGTMGKIITFVGLMAAVVVKRFNEFIAAVKTAVVILTPVFNFLVGAFKYIATIIAKVLAPIGPLLKMFLVAQFQVAWIAIVTQLKMFWELIKSLVIGGLQILGGNTKEGLATIAKGFISAGKVMWEGIKAAFEVIKGVFISAFTYISSLVKPWLDAIGSWITIAWNNIGKFFAGLWTSILGGIESAWGGISSFFAGLWAGILAGVMGWITGVGSSITSGADTAASAVKSPFVAAFEWLKTAWTNIGNFFVGIWASITTGVSSAIASLVSGIKGWIGNLVSSVMGLISGLYDWWINTTVGKIVREVGIAILNFVNGFIGLIKVLVSAVTKILGAMWNLVSTLFSLAFQVLVFKVTKFVNTVTEFFTKLWKDVVKIVTDFYNDMIRGFGIWYDGIVGIITPIWREFVRIFTALWKDVVRIVTDFYDDMMRGFGMWYDAIVGIVTPIWTELVRIFTKLWEDVVRIVTDIVTDVVSGWTKIYNDVKTFVTKLYNEVTEFFTKLWKDVVKIVTDIVTDVVSGWTKIYNDVMEVVTPWYDELVRIVTKLWKDLVKIVTDLVNDIVGHFTTFVADAKKLFTTWYDDAVDLVTRMWTKLVEVFTDIWKDIEKVLKKLFKVFTDIWDDIKDVVNKALDGILKVITKFNLTSVGSDLMEGLKNGIMGAAQGIADAAANIVKGAIEAARKAMSGGSPSRVMMAQGNDFGMGFSIGLNKVAGEVGRAGAGLIDTVIGDWQAIIAAAPDAKALIENLGGVDLTKMVPAPGGLALFEKNFIAYLEQLKFAFLHIAAFIEELPEVWRKDVLPALAETAKLIKDTMDVGMIDLSKMVPVKGGLHQFQLNALAYLEQLKYAFADISEWIKAGLQVWDKDVLTAIAETGAKIKSIMDVGMIDLSKMIPASGGMRSFTRNVFLYMQQLAWAFEAIRDWIEDGLRYWDLDMMKIIDETAGKIKSIMDVGFLDLGKIVPASGGMRLFSRNVSAYMQQLHIAFEAIVTWVQGVSVVWNTDILSAVAIVAGQIKSIVEAGIIDLSKIVPGKGDLYSFLSDIATYMFEVAGVFSSIIQMVEDVTQRWDTEVLEALATAASHIKVIVDAGMIDLSKIVPGAGGLYTFLSNIATYMFEVAGVFSSIIQIIEDVTQRWDTDVLASLATAASHIKVIVDAGLIDFTKFVPATGGLYAFLSTLAQYLYEVSIVYMGIIQVVQNVMAIWDNDVLKALAIAAAQIKAIMDIGMIDFTKFVPDPKGLFAFVDNLSDYMEQVYFAMLVIVPKLQEIMGFWDTTVLKALAEAGAQIKAIMDIGLIDLTKMVPVTGGLDAFITNMHAYIKQLAAALRQFIPYIKGVLIKWNIDALKGLAEAAAPIKAIMDMGLLDLTKMVPAKGTLAEFTVSMHAYIKQLDTALRQFIPYIKGVLRTWGIDTLKDLAAAAAPIKAIMDMGLLDLTKLVPAKGTLAEFTTALHAYIKQVDVALRQFIPLIKAVLETWSIDALKSFAEAAAPIKAIMDMGLLDLTKLVPAEGGLNEFTLNVIAYVEEVAVALGQIIPLLEAVLETWSIDALKDLAAAAAPVKTIMDMGLLDLTKLVPAAGGLNEFTLNVIAYVEQVAVALGQIIPMIKAVLETWSIDALKDLAEAAAPIKAIMEMGLLDLTKMVPAKGTLAQFTAAVTAYIKQLDTALRSFIPMIEDVLKKWNIDALKALAEASTQIKAIMEMGLLDLSKVVPAKVTLAKFKETVGAYIAQLDALITALITWVAPLTAGLPALVTAVNDVKVIMETLIGFSAQITELSKFDTAAALKVKVVAAAIIDALASVYNIARAFAITAQAWAGISTTDFIMQAINSFRSIGVQLTEAIAFGMDSVTRALTQSATQLIMALVQAMISLMRDSVYNSFRSIGVSMMEGMRQGILSMADAVARAAAQVVARALAAARAASDIQARGMAPGIAPAPGNQGARAPGTPGAQGMVLYNYGSLSFEGNGEESGEDLFRKLFKDVRGSG